MTHQRGFTLLEVLVSAMIAGLVITAGYRLIGMSYSLLGRVSEEEALIAASQKIWLMFSTDPETPDNGTDAEDNITWSAAKISMPVIEDYELKCKKVTITLASGRSTIIYVPE